MNVEISMVYSVTYAEEEEDELGVTADPDNGLEIETQEDDQDE